MLTIPLIRTLAIAPGTKHLGFACFEGSELTQFGVKTLEGRKTEKKLVAQVDECLKRLIETRRPNTLAIMDVFYAQRRLSPFLGKLVSAVDRHGRTAGIRVVRYKPTFVKERLCERKRTRQGLAESMVNRYWVLHSFLNRKSTQHYWRQMFDAVGIGTLAAVSAQKSREHS